jgi:PEP-CTERM motif
MFKTQHWSVLAMVALAPVAQAQVLLDLTFDTDATNIAAVTAQYGLTAAGALSAASASGGQLRMSPAGPNGALDFGAFAGDLSISFDASISSFSGPGSINVALRVGGNNIVFHPGYGGGAFRIDGVFGNTDMGFTPNVAVLNHFRVDIDAGARTFAISITDGANSNNVFQYLFSNAGYVPGQTLFGLSTGGSGEALFDNLLVQTPAVPEPSTWALALLGLVTVLGARRRSATGD